MSLANEWRGLGFCAATPKLTTTKQGTYKATLVIYTKDHIGQGEYINQPHRCLFFGEKAKLAAKMIEAGRHIHIRGTLRSIRRGEGKDAHYYTSILVEEFQLSPRQSVESLKSTLREVIDENQITEYSQLGILTE